MSDSPDFRDRFCPLFTSRERQTFLCQHDLEPGMSQRGNCHANAVAESFIQLLKREREKER